MKLLLVLTAPLFSLLAACATQPELPTQLSKDARIGILILIPEQAQYVHVGTTAFNNFTTPIWLPWQPRSYLADQMAQKLKTLGRQPIPLDTPSGLTSNTQLTEADFLNGAKLTSGAALEFEQLIEQNKLDAIFIVKSEETGDYIANTSQHLDGYGLYTRSFFTTSAAVYANFDMLVVLPSPARITRDIRPLSDLPSQRAARALSLPEGFSSQDARLDPTRQSAFSDALKSLMLRFVWNSLQQRSSQLQLWGEYSDK
ncbi:MAG: hypothetical protein OSA97_14925 [Nevskia sp.]|nr:hypothetical protein [Nevskia sp.]